MICLYTYMHFSDNIVFFSFICFLFVFVAVYGHIGENFLMAAKHATQVFYVFICVYVLHLWLIKTTTTTKTRVTWPNCFQIFFDVRLFLSIISNNNSSGQCMRNWKLKLNSNTQQSDDWVSQKCKPACNGGSSLIRYRSDYVTIHICLIDMNICFYWLRCPNHDGLFL